MSAHSVLSSQRLGGAGELSGLPTPRDWLSKVCDARGWDQPSEVGVLGRLKLSDADRNHARSYVARAIALGLPGKTVSAMFCALATDALRQHQPGQGWTWKMVREVWPCQLRNASNARLYELTRDGLAAWGRPLRQAASGDKQYLFSLVLEAGIPASLLARHQFKDFLFQLQAESDRGGISLEAAAGHHVHRLPTAWQKEETLAVAVELLTALRPYREALLSGPQNLQRLHPEWRNALPLDMSDEAATSLIDALLQQPKPPLTQLRVLCRRVLQQIDGVWVPSIAAEAMGWLPPGLCAQSPFDDPGNVRVRFVVGGSELAFAERDSGATWRFRGVQRRPTPLGFDQPVEAALMIDGHSRHRMKLPGGDALSRLPWVLLREPNDSLRFVGHGSQSVPGKEIFLAVDPSMGLLETAQGEASELGLIAGSNRVLFRISGEARWREPNVPFALRLRTGTTDGVGPTLALFGKHPGWAINAPLTTLGAPTITGAGPGQQLLWRPRGAGLQWHRLVGKLPVGIEAEIALVQDGILLDRRRVVVLPDAARIELSNHAEAVQIRLYSLGQTHASVDGYPASLTQEDGATLLVVPCQGLVPGEFVVRTLHQHGLELRHRVRVPMPDGGFIDADGRICDRAVAAALADLVNLIARAGSGDPSPELEITSVDRQGRRVGRVIGFVEDLPLAQVTREVRRQIGSLDSLESEISLRVLRSGIAGPKLQVKPFNLRLRLRGDDGVHLEGRTQAVTGSMAAIALAEPTRDPIKLAKVTWPEGEGWSLADLPPAGPWLLVGENALAGRVKPYVWPGTPATTKDRLARAAVISDPVTRNTTFDQELQAIANADAVEFEAEWAFLDASLISSLYSNAACHDVLRAAGRTPDLLAQWALRTSPANIQQLAELQDHTPYLWCLVPMASWLTAVRAWRAPWTAIGLDSLPSLETRLSDIQALIPGTGAAMWAIRDAVNLQHPPNSFSREMLPFVREQLAERAGPNPGACAWANALERIRTWINLPDDVHLGAPHAAARHVLGLATLDDVGKQAVRTCVLDAPDEFDGRFQAAVMLHIGSPS